VILGDEAGPSKLKAIEKHKLRTLDEDGFMNLIATRKGPSAGGKVDDKTRKKMEKDEEEIKQGARELAKREKEAAKAATSDAGR
jgi:replication factor C subunit 1